MSLYRVESNPNELAQWPDPRFHGWMLVVVLLMVLYLTWGCSRNLRWRRSTTNLGVTADSSLQTLGRVRADTVNRQIMNLLDEEYALLANLVIGNIVKSQQSLYEGRYREAEQLLLQANTWLSSPDVLIALGNVFEVQGFSKRADSCWLEAWKMDSLVERRAIRIPRKPWQTGSSADTVPRIDTSR